MKNKYSILIPTFNRRKYLEKTIQTVLDQNYKDYELIISDSGSTDDTIEFLNQLKHPNIKIFIPKKKLSEVENFEFILDKASSEWVSIIGDDDGITPNFFNTLDKVTEKYKNIQAISSKAAYYYHENVDDLYGDRVVSYNYVSDLLIKKNSKIHLLMCLMGLKNRNDIPSLYTTGVIKRELIEKIKRKSQNKFFHSIIEDYYSMVAILFETNHFVRVEKPLFWVGSSKNSSGKGLSVYENNKNVENYLKLSEKVSEELHRVGISSIYYLEAIYKHPYISNFWKSKFINIFTLAYAYLDIQSRRNTDRIKTDLSISAIISIIFQEVKNKKNSKVSFYFYIFILKTLFFFKKINLKIIKIFSFIKKKMYKSIFLTINSNDRKTYSSIPVCNKIILENVKKN